MADNVVDKEIVDLPEAVGVTGDTVFPAYVPGAIKPAQKVSGAQLSYFAANAGYEAAKTITKGDPGPPGSDASVTTENIKKALGYTPANQEDLDQLSEDKVGVIAQTFTDGQKAQARKNISAAEKFMLTPDDFDGTDTEKIQACFDALTDVGGVITINRSLKLTGNVQIKNDSGMNHQITVQASGKHSVIDMGEYYFYGLEDVPAGLVSFDNIQFKGTQNCFDCSYLVRLRFDGCFFSGFEHVIHSDRYIQSVNIVNSYVRSVSGYIYNAPNLPTEENLLDGNLYDCKFSHNVVEGSNGIAKFTSASGSHFTGNCIEGNTGSDDLFVCWHHMLGVEISRNYFEVNNGHLVDFTKATTEWSQFVVTICNNNFIEMDEGKVMIVMPTIFDQYNSQIIVHSNNMPVGSQSVFIKSEATGQLKSVVCLANAGTVIDENGSVADATSTLISNMIRRSKNMYPSGSMRFEFASMLVASHNNSQFAYCYINTPYYLPDCDISSLTIYSVGGGLTPKSVSVASKYNNSFTIEMVFDSGTLMADEVRTCSGAYYLSFN